MRIGVLFHFGILKQYLCVLFQSPNFCMQTFTKLVSKPHDLGEMSCDRASLARLCPKSVVLDLGVPVQCKMQKRFSLHLENGPHHMSTAPCAWSWAAFPPDWKMFSPYFVFGLKEEYCWMPELFFSVFFCFTCAQRRCLQSNTLPIPEDH